MTAYRCTDCKKVVERDSMETWIESYCEQTGLMTLLLRCADTEGSAR